MATVAHVHPVRVPALVIGYLAAIAAANVIVSRIGPGVSVATAFALIGLDLTARDSLHEAWGGRGLWWRMLALIAGGGVLSLALGGDGRIALASCLAFVAAGLADTAAYAVLGARPRLARINGSNVVASAVDSLAFPILAFGWPPLWGIVAGQFLAKVGGGFVWSLILARRRRP